MTPEYSRIFIESYCWTHTTKPTIVKSRNRSRLKLCIFDKSSDAHGYLPLVKSRITGLKSHRSFGIFSLNDSFSLDSSKFYPKSFFFCFFQIRRATNAKIKIVVFKSRFLVSVKDENLTYPEEPLLKAI